MLRVTALNGVGSWGLLNQPSLDLDADPRCRPRAMHALFNERPNSRMPAVPIEALAQWLAERPQAFRWSHFGSLPAALRCLVWPGIRLCPACMAGGYHTVLFSLVLLRRCPIHGCNLMGTCTSGHVISDLIDGAVLRQAGHCSCGKAAFFTRQTCRRPRMAAEDTKPLQPVVDWLDQIISVSRPTFERYAAGAHDRRFLASIEAVCDALDLPFPDCFDSLSPLAPRTVVESRTIASAQAAAIDVGSRDVEGALLGAFSRHLRRHVAPRALQAGIALMERPDPLRMAATMRDDPRATAAFAMLVFAGSVEVLAPQRRWPHRLTDVQETWMEGHPNGYRRSFSAGAGPPANAWQAWHAAEVSVVQTWRRAQLAALGAIRSGIADWRRIDTPDQSICVARLGAAGQHFVSMPEIDRMDWTLTRPDKAARRQAAMQATSRRQALTLHACLSPALAWCPSHAWRAIVNNGAPAGQIVRLALLGVQGRPKFWLFQRGTVFIARVCAFPVQSSGDSPKAAIDALRAAASRYLDRFPLATPSKVPVSNALPEDVAQQPAWHRLAITQLASRYGFWRAAGPIQDAVYAHLSRTRAAAPASSADGDSDLQSRPLAATLVERSPSIDTTSLET